MEEIIYKKITTTNWYPEQELIITHISGLLNEEEIASWEKTLYSALDKIPDNGKFKILVNLHGFKAASFPAHKRFREIIPFTLAKYGWKTGYIELFEEEAKNFTTTVTRGINCFAAAHCHQDETKIHLYEEHYSRNNEHYFTDPAKALAWIKTYSQAESRVS